MNALCIADVVEIPVFASGMVFSGKVRNLFDVVLFYLFVQIFNRQGKFKSNVTTSANYGNLHQNPEYTGRFFYF
jgi:hypothetical protein